MTWNPIRVLSTICAGLMAAVALSVLAPASAGAADMAPGPTGWVRAGHLAAGQGAADVTLTPFDGGSPVRVRDVTYGEVTPFATVPAGLYTVTVRPADAADDTPPMIRASVRVEPDRARTVLAIGDKDDVQASVLDDDLRAPAPGKAKVRLVSAATGSQTVDVSVVDGPVLARDVATGGSTGYAEVGAQTWSIRTLASGSQLPSTQRVPVRAGGVYTLFVVGEGDDVSLEAVQDAAGSSTMPRGGVATGGGGLADAADRAPADPTPSGPTVAIVAGLVAGLVAACAAFASIVGARVVRREVPGS